MNLYQMLYDEATRLFHPWRAALSNVSHDIVRKVRLHVENHEDTHGIRQRKRRKTAQETFELTVESLVADLIHNYITTRGEGAIAVSRDGVTRKSRYNAPTEGKVLPYVIDLLCHPRLGYAKLRQIGSRETNQRSLYEIGPALIHLTQTNHMTVEHLTRRPGEEIVIQKSEDKSLVEYKDNKLTEHYRAEVREINDMLEGIDLYYPGSRLVDRTAIYLRRVFNNKSFRQGGRLFGAFWQHDLNKQQRSLLTMDGENVASLDFKTMLPSLAYAKIGAILSPGADAYAINGYMRHRKGIKKLFAAMMFTRKRLGGWPEGVDELLPGAKLADVIGAIQKAHPALEPLWFTGVGHEFHFTESEVLVDILLRLKRQYGIPALPVHDCIVVPESAVRVAVPVMLEAFEVNTGGVAEVVRES